MSEAISVENQKIPATEVLAKEGYKKTNLGWIPEGWNLTSLNKVSQIKGDYGINAAAVEFSPKLPTYLRITDIDKDGNFLEDGKKSVDDSQSGNFILKEGDVVFARTGASVGKTYFHHKKNGKLIFAGFLIRFRTKISLLLPKYLFYYTHSNLYWNWVKVNSMRSGQPGINSKEYGNLPFPLPPLPEQQKIAAILSTWDNAIGKQEQLIAAKQHYKKGLMQLLLTGKKRFDGFIEDWKEVKLKDVFSLSSGSTKPEDTIAKYDSYHTIPVYGGNGISGYSNKGFNEGISLLIGRVGEYCGIVHLVDGLYWITDNCLYTKTFDNQSNIIYYSLLLKYLKLNRLKNKGGQPLVTQKPILNLKVKVPTHKEQQKIASVLSKADKEIALLQNQLTQLQTQKRGLVQKLLTGAVMVKI